MTLSAYQSRIDEGLQDYLNCYTKTAPDVVHRAMAYSLLAKGKRMRPVLLLATCHALSGNQDNALPFACALEMVHAYSLIHDDLPAMDDDDYRRGRPTNHKVFGEGVAVLAGDGLLNLAYEIMTDSCIEHFCLETIQAMNVIARCAGVRGMIGGQAADLEAEGKAINAEMLDYIQRNKTGALLEAAFTAGGWLAGGSGEVISLLAGAGRDLGVAFQIQDDILDLTATTESLGKPTHSDERNSKATYVSMFGIEQAKAKVHDLFGEVLLQLNSVLKHDEFITSYLNQLMRRRN